MIKAFRDGDHDRLTAIIVDATALYDKALAVISTIKLVSVSAKKLVPLLATKVKL